ncbi:tannase/feruloyl esterase family alpha/beta hydrolase [Bacillus sp. JJ1533]|uniref:tannase/feruloyl esterase family alpha/beta hydrolase n=1 Tax=Bacillus sp. JJ1533 TaxID=3122959 RepID=UPI003000F2C0
MSSLFIGQVFAKTPQVQTSDLTGNTACSNLVGMVIPADDIGLPTSGATITSASLKIVEDLAIKDAEYCEVLGAIHPVDPTAPDINFQINLPTNWNKKFLQFGGGYFNGTVRTGLGNPPAGDRKLGKNTPLAQGYVTFGSDSGNSTAPLDASFAMNDEALKNFAGDQLKKTKDVALALANVRYNAVPDQVYFAGGSEGGREGLFIVQNFPDEYDGVISVYPVLNWIPKALKDNRDAQALYKNDGEGWISPEENDLINETVFNACDSLDGVKDGIISNTSECAEKEDEILDTLGESLSEKQIEVIKSFNGPMEFDIQLANDFTTMPGYSQLQGADIGRLFGTRPIPSVPPVVSESVGHVIDEQDALMGVYSDQVIRYKITRNPDFNTLTFDPNEYSEEILKASNLLDVTDPNISEFRENGGKLILVHGTEDEMVAPQGTTDYYSKLVNEFGQESLDEFAQYYLVPGFSHGGGNFTMSADLLGALDAWVVNGDVPSNLVAEDQNSATFGRTRPLCEYPTYPQYNGSGDVNSAASFTCVEADKDISASDIQKLIEKFEVDGEFANHGTARSLQAHLDILIKLESQEREFVDQKVKHTQKFIKLLDNHKKNGKITDHAYNTLKELAESYIKQIK